jgi:predicted transcriptional regulator
MIFSTRVVTIDYCYVQARNKRGLTMFGDTSDLAENKLLLLFIFDKIKLPISNIQITQIVLENNFINYFTLHQYISELVHSKFLEYTGEESKHRLAITAKGSRVLSMFIERLPKNKIEVIEGYLDRHLEKIKKEVTISADYTIEGDTNYIVNLKAIENNVILIDLKLNVPSNKQARDLCSRWKSNSAEIYNNILSQLID